MTNHDRLFSYRIVTWDKFATRTGWHWDIIFDGLTLFEVRHWIFWREIRVGRWVQKGWPFWRVLGEICRCRRMELGNDRRLSRREVCCSRRAWGTYDRGDSLWRWLYTLIFLIGTRGSVDSICPADGSEGTERGAEKDIVKPVQTRAVKLCIQGCAIKQLGE